MSLFERWCRFNAIGMMGMAVQLAAVAFLNRVAPNHYLLATAAALEITLVHNFLWHLRYTWSDRRDSSALVARFAKFHLANGMVSLSGNLALVEILVTLARMPLLVANGIAILVCSSANFGLGHVWTFAPRNQTIREGCANRQTECALSVQSSRINTDNMV